MEGGDEAAAGELEYGRYVTELVTAKTLERGDDLTSWLIDHPADLTYEEVVWQVFITMAAGHEPTANLVANALSRILGNPVYYSTLTSGSRPVMDAVVEVLRHETPLANYGILYARESLSFHGVWVRRAVPVIVSYGSLGYFSEQAAAGAPHHPHDASHLSWGAERTSAHSSSRCCSSPPRPSNASPSGCPTLSPSCRATNSPGGRARSSAP